MRHIINLQVENQSGVLARIAGLFSARGFNIESLSVGKMDSEAASHMTLVVRGDDWIIEQVIKQLNKLIDVYRVTDVTSTTLSAGNWFWSRSIVLLRNEVTFHSWCRFFAPKLSTSATVQ
jgi:acetolactate synthase small subunit